MSTSTRYDVGDVEEYQCDGCDSRNVLCVLVGQAPGYESSTAWLCTACLRDALAKLDAKRKAEDAALMALIERARTVVMTDEERREQAASFAFGQVALTKEWANATPEKLAALRDTCRRLAGCTS